MKKLVSTFLSLLILFALTTSAFAFNGESTATIDSYATNSEPHPQTTPINISPFKLQNVGDTYVLAQDEGGILYVEVVDSYDTIVSVMRAGKRVTSTKKHYVRYKNWLGNVKDVVVINAFSTWIDAGVDSYIEDLHGKYDILDDDFSCVWNDDRAITDDEYYQVLGLDIYHGTSRCEFDITATLIPATVPTFNILIDQVWCE